MATLAARKSGLQVKLEVTEGTDPGSWVSADMIALTAITDTLNPDTQQLNEFGGSLDAGETVVGATKPVLTARGAFRGSGVGETPLAPFSALMQAAGFVETLRSATIPAAGATTVVTATGNTVTFPYGTDWPASTAAGLTGAAAVLGEVVEIAGNPATPTWAQIIDYSVLTTNCTLTLSRNATDCNALGAVFTSATTIRRQKGTKWIISSPSPHPSVYARQFRGGVMQAFSGCRPNARFTATIGSFCEFEFALGGQFVSRTDVAVPAAPAFLSPPVGVNGFCTFNGGSLVSQQLGIKSLSVDLGNQGMYPDDINATSGVQAYLIGSRKIKGTLDPLLTLVATRNLLALMTAGTKGTLALGWGPKTGYSSNVGNKLGFTFPATKFLDDSIAEDNVVLRETTPWEPTTFDGGIIIYHW